jgi:aminoglycoside phosphotransferase (APT) family kinase protein
LLTRAWESALSAPEWGRTPGWIHGDLLPGNVLVRDGKLAAVIDFGGSGLGDPAADLLPAWSLISGAARGTYRRALGVDDGTWDRGRGWALSVALLIIPYYRETNPAFSAMAAGMVREVLADFGS